MSGTQVSSFYPVNQLLQDNAQQIQNYYAPQRNQLLIQEAQQRVGANEIEYAARAAQGLLSLNDEAAMAAAYPSYVAEGQKYGFLKNAPSVFPGVDRLRQIASYGIPAEKQYEQQGVRSAADAIRGTLSGGGAGTGGTTAAPGGGAATVVAIPARGTGGPGAGATVPTEWLPYFYEASRETGIPVELLIAQARQESSFNPNARGAAGEIGLFQIMPSTAQSPGFGLTGVDPGSLTGPENVRNNILFGARYLRARGGAGDPNNPAWQANALRSYNAGGDPNYVANVNRYRPTLASSDPAAAVTTYTPGGATQPGQPAPYQTASLTPTPPPSGATPAAPAQPAATTTAQGTTPAQQPPAAPAAALPAPPPPVGADGLNAQQRQTVNGMLSTARTPAQLQQVQAQMQTYRDHNDTVQRQYQADLRQAQKDAEAAADKARTQDLAQRREIREQAKFDQEQVAANRPYPGNTPEAADMNILIAGSQPGGDPSTVEYANAYTRQRFKEASNGNVIARDMSMFTQPTRQVAAPTVTAGPSAVFERENKLRDEFQKLTADFRVVQNSYENLQETAKKPSGAGDMSLLYSYVRLLDPTSVVRESEFATAAASGSFGERIQGAVGRILSGERLPDSLRQDFVREARNLYNTQLRNHNQMADTYTRLAKDSGVDPEKVVTRFDRPQQQPVPPPDERKAGAVYQTPKGPMKWTGTGWLPAGE